MFIKFHKMKEERDERGFTLIELLVVILIIAILAAIAIPAFLNQRKKGWESQAKSALKNGATAAESYATGTAGDYTGMGLTDLATEGYNETAGVVLDVAASGATGYCLRADHTSLTPVGTYDFYYDSTTGEPNTTDCSGSTY